MSTIDAELTALGCMLQDGALAKETILHLECFQQEQNRLVFRAIRSVVESGTAVDYVTVAEKFGKHLQRIGGMEYLIQLTNSVPTTANFDHYERILMEAWKKRQAVAIALTMKTQIEQEDNDEALPSAIRDLVQLEEFGHKQSETKSVTLARMHEEIAQRDGKIRGIRFGYTEFDKMTNGGKKGQLIIVGGRPAMGKTAFAVCMGINAADLGTAVTVFSLEMDKEELYERGVSAQAMIPNEKMRNPAEKFTNDDWHRYNLAFGKLNDIPIEVEDKPAMTLAKIRAVMRKRQKQYPTMNHLCIIDYLQLIHGNKRLKRHEEVAEIARGLKELARDLKMTVVALSQLSRDVDDRADKRPMMSDLRESGEIEQSADIITFLYRPAYYNKEFEDQTLVELIVAKQRGGRTGTIPLQFLGEYTLMKNCPERM